MNINYCFGKQVIKLIKYNKQLDMNERNKNLLAILCIWILNIFDKYLFKRMSSSVNN